MKIHPLYKEYKISSDGLVFDRKNKKFLKQTREIVNEKVRRVKVRLRFNPRCKTIPVHQLVMACYGSPKPSPLHSIDHKDRNPENNKIKNLRWATNKEQIENRTTHRKAKIKLSLKDIEIMRLRAKKESLKQIADSLKIPHLAVAHILMYVSDKY